MIQIYNQQNTEFEKNGDMTLFPNLATVHAVINGAWEVKLKHPIDKEGRWKYIDDNAVVKMPSFNGEQLFRIKKKEKRDSEIEAELQPIFMDAKDDCFLLDVRPTGKNGQQALDIMTEPNKKYAGKSDITKATTAYYYTKNLIEAIAGDDENSFLNRWGGEILYDNFNIVINKRIGSDNGVEVLYGKNIKQDGFSEEVDMRDVVTRIIPKAFNGYMIEGQRPWVDSPLIDKYPNICYRVIEFADVKMIEDASEEDAENGIIVCNTKTELETALRKKCEEQYEQGIDKPKVTITADIEILENTDIYKDVKEVERVSLGDTVHCRNKKLDVVTDARVVEIEWDCIRKKVNYVVIGDFQYNYISEATSMMNRVENVIRPDGSLMAEKVQGILDGIYTQLKIQSTVAKKVNGRAFVVEDTDEDSDMYGCMVWGTQGLQLAVRKTQDGRDWDFTTAITAKGIVADAIIAGILSDKNGRNYWNLDTGEFRLSAEAFKVDDETVKEYVDGAIDDKVAKIRTLTMQLSNEFQGISTGSDGSGGNYSECYTDVKVFIGTTDITESDAVRYTVNPSAGVTGAWNVTKKRYTVSYLSTDDGTVAITASYSGLVITKTFTISKVKQGDGGTPGKDGKDGRVYILQADTLVLKQGADDVYSPQKVTFQAYYRDGQTADRVSYKGRFVIQETTDGTNYTTKYTSATNESSHEHTPTAKNVKNIRCILYAAGGTTTTLDMQGVAVVRDVDNLSQKEVFDILTNKGQDQGIFLKDGKLYINAEYLVAGRIADLKEQSFWDLVTGEMQMTGEFRQFAPNGIKSVEIINNQLRLFDWEENGKYSGAVASLRSVEDGQGSVGIVCAKGNKVSLSYFKEDGDGLGMTSYPAIEFDSSQPDNTPFIVNTASGILFPNNPDGGITVENGLIKKWSMWSVLNDTLRVMDSSGKREVEISVRDGLITSWKTREL